METIKLNPEYTPKYKYIITSKAGESETFESWSEVVDYVIDGKEFNEEIREARSDYIANGYTFSADDCLDFFSEYLYDELAEEILTGNGYTILKASK